MISILKKWWDGKQKKHKKTVRNFRKKEIKKSKDYPFIQPLVTKVKN
jgi:hypothetical protein